MTTEQRLERENRWMRRIGAVAVVVLLIGGSYAVYHFATSEPVEVESEAARQARIKAEELAKRAREEQIKAQKNMRRNKAEARAGRHANNELQLRLRNPIGSVYDNEQKAAAREAEWNSLANEYEEWSRHELAKEFEDESQYSSFALQRAEKIREQLRNFKASTTDRRTKIAEMVKKAKDINKKLQDQLGDMRLGRSYEKAANLCELVATGQPRKNDPFREVVAWEWLGPADSSLRQAATEVEEITRIVNEFREGFRKERAKLLSEAKKVTDQALGSAASLPETAADDEYTKLIEELDKLIDAFVHDAPGVKHVREIHRHAGALRKERDRLTQELARRRAKGPR